MSAAKVAANRLEDRAGRLREEIDPAVQRAREVVERAPDAAGRVTNRAAERLADDGRETAERLAEEGRQAAERVAHESREAADRVGQYLEEHEEEVAVWGPRLGFAVAGFVAGLLLGWLLSRGGGSSAEDDVEHGFAQAPPTRDRASREGDGGAVEDTATATDRL